jgi:probable HAF family extracellular repeat protein
MIGLGDLPGGVFDSFALAVSADGSTVVGRGWGASGEEAFRWTNGGGMVGLGDLPGGDMFESEGLGVSADGATVVGTGYGDSGPEAFIWDAIHGMRELDVVLADLGLGPALSGWHLTSATAISDDGLAIVGFGRNPSFQTEAWLVVIPEPGTASLIGVGLLTLAAARRRAS